MDPGSAAEPTAFGKYQLFASLGKGGMADVFLAVARGPMGFNKLAVIKRLRTQLAEEGSFLNMFLDEARLAARLNHPNVVHTYEVGEQAGSYFIAMEYLEGQSLNKIIKEASKSGAPITPAFAARVVADALAGLHHAHELKDYDGTPLAIVHRDVSPHNVFVTYDGQVKLVDFGIAKAALSSTQTEVGVLKGKVAYMAPEQATGGSIDRRADVFGMGIVLWELLTKKRLMAGDSAAATLNKLLNMPVPRARSVLLDLDPKLDDILAKALEKDRDKRFQSAHEMRQALEEWLRSTGQIVGHEEVGAYVSQMFSSVREEVKQQIQKHMSQVGRATTTQELQTLNVESLRSVGGRIDTPLIPMSTGSGSGVVPLGPEGIAGADQSLMTTQLLLEEERRRRNKLVWLLLILLVVFSGVAFLIVRFAMVPRTIAAQPVPTNDTIPQTPATNPTPAPTDTPTAVDTTPPDPPLTSKPTKTVSTKPLPPAPPNATRTPAPTTSTGGDPAPVATTGFLNFTTYPWTRVSEGGRMIGTTPLYKIALSPGSHTLTLENPEEGIKTSYTVNIKSGETTSRSLGLK